MEHETPITPTATIAERVRQLRKRRGWRADELADAMKEQGFPWSRLVVTKLETGKRPSVSVGELLALARLLDVAPVHLLVPVAEDDQQYAVTPEQSAAVAEVRAWIRGLQPLDGTDARVYFSEVPPREFGIDITGTITPALAEKLRRDIPGGDDGER